MITENPLFKLVIAILTDAFGMFSYALPFLGEVSDLIFAPINALIIFLLFHDLTMSIVAFGEESLPFTDIVPSTTLAWLRYYGYIPR
jgi:hypothetical protein